MDIEVLAATFLPHVVISAFVYFGLGGLMIELTQLPRIILAVIAPSVIGGALWLASKTTGMLSELLLASLSAIGSL